jgi:dTDP-4-dehydrorhamnose reductase
MRALVIGGSGQIGGWLLRHLADRGHEAVGTFGEHPYPGLVHFDAADLAAAARLVAERRPDVVFYPAGFTWVDGCERDPARSDSANRDQPLNVARAAAEAGGRFVSFSTDYVFDGRNGPDSEESGPNPLSAYGRSKLDAERRLAGELGDRALTIRTAWVFGPERQGKNFAYQLVRALNAGKPVTVPSDQVSSPSYGPDVALAAVRLAEMGASGLIHVAGPQTMPRPEFARGIAEGFGLDPSPISARPTAELGQGAPRPLRGGLSTPRLDATLPGVMRTLADSVADFRARLAEPGAPWADPLASES